MSLFSPVFPCGEYLRLLVLHLIQVLVVVQELARERTIQGWLNAISTKHIWFVQPQLPFEVARPFDISSESCIVYRVTAEPCTALLIHIYKRSDLRPETLSIEVINPLVSVSGHSRRIQTEHRLFIRVGLGQLRLPVSEGDQPCKAVSTVKPVSLIGCVISIKRFLNGAELLTSQIRATPGLPWTLPG